MNKAFTENFCEMFEDKGLTQAEFAKQTGISRNLISKYLQGVLPRTANVVKICDFFGCSIDYIVNLSDEFSYRGLKKNFSTNKFFQIYQHLLIVNGISHYQLSLEGIVCETSLSLWKKGKLPRFDVLCELSKRLGGSVDEFLGRI